MRHQVDLALDYFLYMKEVKSTSCEELVSLPYQFYNIVTTAIIIISYCKFSAIHMWRVRAFFYQLIDQPSVTLVPPCIKGKP
jgi:hypothetical protein